MRSMMVVATLAFAVACTKEPAAPAAKVEEAPAKAAAKAPEAAKPAPAPAAMPADALAFDQSHGKVEFVGAKVTGSHRGTFKQFAGKLAVPEGAPEKGQVEVTIQVASLETDSAKLDGHLRSNDFFDVENIPTATFRSTAIAKAAEGFTVTGDLTLHGVTKSISFPATIAAGADKVAVNAAFTIDRKQFGIVYPGMPDDLIRDAVEIELALEVPRAAAPTAAVPQ